MSRVLLITAFLASNAVGQSTIAVKCQKVGDLAETSAKFAVAGIGVERAISKSFELYPDYPKHLITYEVPIAFYALKELQRRLPNPPAYAENGQTWNAYWVTEFRKSRQEACVIALS
jgi:hypothetical protein